MLKPPWSDKFPPLIVVECVVVWRLLSLSKEFLVLSYIQLRPNSLEALSLVTTERCSLWHAVSRTSGRIAMWLSRNSPWVRIAYCLVSVCSLAALKLFEPVRLSHFADRAVCGLGNTFKSTPHPTQTAPMWVQLNTNAQPSTFQEGSFWMSFSLVL